jgi:hypothetical protein
MTEMDRRLITLDVPEGAGMESQSGLQMNHPRIYGAGATHYLEGQPSLLEELCDCLTSWIAEV